MIIIALAGRAQHGKTSLAGALVNHLLSRNRVVFKQAFAGALKRMLRELGVPHNSLYGTGEQKDLPLEEFGFVSGRHLMQTLGTGWGRELIGDDFWCLIMDKELKFMGMNQMQNDVVIIDDVRHVPEIEMLRRHGAYIFEVYRPAPMPTTLLGKIKHWFKNLRAHSSERLDFQKHGLTRIVVEEGDSTKTLQKVLAQIPELQ